MDTRENMQTERFCRQFLQLEPTVKYPEGHFLRLSEVQETLYQRLFADGVVTFPPPPRYQLKVLKELISRIEASIEDWEEHGVSENLISALSPMLCVAPPPESETVPKRSYATYHLSQLSAQHGTNPSITLLESRSLIASGGTTGLRTWEAALHMGQYLCLNESIVQGKHVIELGAGTGYLSILCAKYLGASSVIASDGSDDVVNSLADGFFLNGLQGSSTIAPMDLKWGTALVGTEDSQWNGGRPVDLVLGADITYDVRIIPALVGTLTELSSLYPGVEIIICATQRNLNTPEVFVRQCASVGYQVKDVDFNPTPHDEQQGPFYNTSVPIRIIRCTSKPTKYSVGSGN